MQATRTSRGRIAIIGAGPGGMATALAARRCGFDVALYERYPEIKAAGNILNLWPPPQKVLRIIGSKGRSTLVGDAAHPTSPYAAYGAGMSIEDGYFLARELAAIDLADRPAVQGALQRYEDRRKPHTGWVTEQARFNGRIFHHTPGLCSRCAISSSIIRRFCKRSSATRRRVTS